MPNIEGLIRDLDAVVVFRHVAECPVLRAFRALGGDCGDGSPTALYSGFVTELFRTHYNFSNFLLDAVAEDENRYVNLRSRGEEVPEVLRTCVEEELKLFQQLSDLTAEELQKYVHQRDVIRRTGFLPSFETTKRDFAGAYEERIAKIRSTGYGMYAHHTMFRLEGEEIVPITSPDTRVLKDLYGYKHEKEQLLANTRALLDGKPAANTLLYGAAGTGKSSSVKAVTNELAGEGLRLLELKKSQLHDIPKVMEELRNNPLKFIIFVDDLSFQKDDDNFATLKAILEGSASVKAPNTVIYATSNRRHLIRESFADREGDVVDVSGRVLGRHRGYWHYTIGQRKGLGIAAPEPLYVVRIDACRNRVVLGGKDALCVRSFRVDEMNWMAQAETDAPLACGVKIRSTGAPRGPVTFQDGVCTAPEGLAGVAPGQSAVFYGADGVILCGGVIGEQM